MTIGTVLDSTCESATQVVQLLTSSVLHVTQCTRQTGNKNKFRGLTHTHTHTHTRTHSSARAHAHICIRWHQCIRGAWKIKEQSLVWINPLKPIVSVCTTFFKILNLCIRPTQCICAAYGCHNKQRLFPQTALTGWALKRRRNVFPVWYELNFYIFRKHSVFKGLTRDFKIRVCKTRGENVKYLLPWGISVKSSLHTVFFPFVVLYTVIRSESLQVNKIFDDYKMF
jgi:hypothetical protein